MPDWLKWDWHKAGTIGVWVYTVITAFILIATTYQGCVARRTFVYSQRPNIVLKDIELIKAPAGFGIVPHWENTGNTAASVTASVNFLFSRDPPPANFFLVDGTSYQFSLGPKEASTSQFVGIPDSCVANAAQNIFRFAHVWGVARYKDELSGTQRITRFAWRLLGILPTSAAPEHFNHAYAESGNCSDDECKVYDGVPPPKPYEELCLPIRAVPPQSPAPQEQKPGQGQKQ